jgi:Spy/CpxP family protein refolding chaperone
MSKVYKTLLMFMVAAAVTVVADTDEEEAFAVEEVYRQEQVHDVLNTVKEDQLLDILFLTPEEEDQFLDIYRELEDMRLEYRKEKIGLISRLQKDLAAGDIAAVADLLDTLEANADEATTDVKNLRADMRGLLADEQYAKFVVFEANFEKKLMRLVMENRPAVLKKAYEEGESPAGAGAPATEAADKE